ncbi:hypothetical protein HJG60_011466 [Phyllostomus discolor]|uniref:Uncharacterized protein n=1 Tax=Phyllostomus discolor TaxID=89673 RepID=A0A834DXB5_9CHIR|nr:hypothetical protein HJG60_011466 [Phyllostomus discolor]
MENLVGRVFLVAGLCFLLFGIFLPGPFWLVMFLLGSQLLALSGLPCMLFPVSSLLPLRFSVFEFCHFSYDVSWSGPLWFYLGRNPLCFLDLCDFFFHQIREVLRDFFFKQVFYPLLLFFWYPYNIDTITFHMSCSFFNPSLFFLSLFCFSCSFWKFFFLPCPPAH